MDTDDIETAKNVWRWNQNGWGHSSSGYNGPYTMAATIDGGIVADYITAGTMLANRIKGGTLTLGGAGNGDGVCDVYDDFGNLVASISNAGILLKKGKVDISSDDISENYIDLRWQYTYPSGTQYYRTAVSSRSVITLIQDPDGTKRYAELSASGISIGKFSGDITHPVSYTSDTYMSAGGISDGTAYSGIVTVDGRRFTISGGIVKNVQ